MNEPAEQLLARAGAGDSAAAAGLVAQTYERVYAFLRRLSGHDADAQDLTQRTFAKVWNSLGSYRSQASVSTWIHSIAYHVYVDWRRQSKPADAKADDWWENCPAAGPSPFEDAARHDAATRLYALVEGLPAEARELVHLHYYQELTLQECAEVLDIAVSTVKYRLRNALDRLQSLAAEPRPHLIPTKL